MKKILSLISLLFLVYFSEAQAPIAYYPFSGNAGDSSGSANHGTVNGATLTTDRFGNANSAYSFDGVDDFVQVPDNSTIDLNVDFTINTWIFPTGEGTQGNGGILVNKENSYSIARFPDGSINFALSANGTGSDWVWVSTGITAPLNTWSYISLIKNGMNVTAYLNGISVSTITSQPNTLSPNASNLRIGGRTDAVQHFEGKLDEVKIYNNALTAAQVLNEYNASSNNLVAYYPFTGNANDAIGSNNGTVNGATLTTDGFGNANSAYAFDGVDDYFQVPTTGYQGIQSYTIQFWLKSNGANNGTHIWESTNFSSPSLEGSASTGYLFYVGNSSPISTGPLNSGIWYHVACVYDKGNNIQTLYINGVSQGTNSVNVNDAIGSELYFMTRPGFIPPRNVNGVLDEVKIYTTALTSAQVLAEFNATAPSINYASQFGNSVLFNGINDAITMPNNPAINFGTGNFAIEFWYKSPATSRNEIMFEKRDDNCGDGKLWAITKTPANEINIVVNVPNSSVFYSLLIANAFDNKWHHLAFIRNGTQMIAYKDGIQNASLTTATVEDVSNTANLGIGTGACSPFYQDGGFFTGSFDEVRIWNTARMATEIQSNMNAQLTGNETGLVGYWDMNRNGEGAGLSVDNKATATGAALNGTTFGTASTPVFAPGFAQQAPGSGNALSFDGMNDYIDAGNSNEIQFNNTSLSIEAWINPSTIAEMAIVEKYQVCQNGYLLRLNANGTLAASTMNSNTCSILNSNTIVSTNKWTHVMMTFDVVSQEMKLFINGILDNSLSNSNIPSGNSNHLFIGKRGDLMDLFFQGKMDEVRIWNTALTQSQIRDRMCRKITASDALFSNLVAYYNFDESSGNIAFDGSINGNDATLVNSPTRVTSGAAIGNTSAHSYAGASSSVNLAHPTRGDDLTATLTAGAADGIHIYNVNEEPNTRSGVSGLASNNAYFGTFVVGGTSPTYNAVYNYDGIPNFVSEPSLALFGRNNNGIANWTAENVNINTTANTLSLTGIAGIQKEFIVGENIPGIISSSQNSCLPITPTPLTGTDAFNAAVGVSYQWQDSIVGGIWTNISGATTGASYAPPLLSSPKYIRRLATLNSITIPSNEVFLDIHGAISPSIIPLNSWNVYAYNGTDLNLGASTTYQGYYTVSGLVVNSESLWNANAAPSTAAGYQGCTVNQAPWTIAAKRQGFTPDNYILTITSVDNGVRAYLDGNEIFAAGGFGPYPNITLGGLNTNSVIEVRAENSGGPGYLNFNLQTSALQGGTIGSNQTSCESFMPALLTNSAIAFGGSLLTMSYQWQESMDDINYTDIVGATSLTYQPDSVFADKYFRRKVTNANNEMAFSNAVFMDINGPVFYADTDGDGFGDINNTIQACSVPMGYVVNNTDCNDNDSLQKPGQIWYLDADNDGYKAFIATMTQCTRPVNRKAFSELLSNQGDCNDNNNHIHPGAQYLNFTGANNYVSNICNPLIGDAFTNFRYEVNYFNIYNEMPENGAPRLSVDLGQNFIVEANDKRLSMQQDDVNDLNTMDGKKYFLIVNGIQPGIPLQSYVSPHLLTCDYLGPFLNEPEVVNYPNLSVAAKDISFSNYNPDVSTTITVEVVVQNNSSFDAINIPVRLVNQFDTTQFFPIQTIPFIAKNDVASVTWTITTPPISALCPMKVIVDYGNTLNETNENDNTAIRGFVNGNGSISGGIAVTSSVTPKTVLVGAGNPGQATLTGNAQYTGLALALNNASVPGAEVFCTIVETGQTFQGTTDANGDFSIPFAVPIGAGTYHISGTVYDFTWAGVMNASTNDFTVVPALGQPDLVPMVSFESSNPLLAGNKIKAKYYSYNFGFIPTTANHTCKLTIIGPSGYLFEDSTLIASLNNGTASAEVPIETPILNAIGTYFVTVTTDLNDAIIESGESNNSITIPIEVIPEQVDLISGSASASGGNIICNNQLTVQTFVKNNGSIATSSGHTALMNLKQGNTVVGTQTFLVPVLQSKEELILTHTFTIPYSPNSYVVEVTADINNIVLESNETNNTMATILNIDTCKADLQLADFCNKVEIVATNNNYTAPVTLKAIITNKGSHTITQPVKVRFTFDNNAFFDYIHNSPIAPLDIINVSLPNVTLPAGATTMIVEIDPLNTIEEINNSNNNSDVKNLGLDFAPSLAGCITPMSNFIVYTGGLVNLRSSIRSNNLYGVDSVKTSFSISGPGIIGIQDLGSVYLYNVSPTCFCPQVATLPTVYLISQPGTYQIYIKSDPDNDIAESDETNNELVISLTTQDVPDMMMHTTFINPSNLNPAAGQGITTQVSYKNLGVGNVGDTMKLKLMIDNVAIDSVVNATGLPSNGTATYAFNTPWSSVQPGVHLIKAIIDDGNAITESNETNNMAVRAIIVGDAANMYFDSLGSLNLYPQLGDSAIIYADIGNNGTLGCTSLLTFYFLNDFNDTLLIRNYTMSVAPNGHQIITFKWKVIDEKTVVVAKLTNSTVQEFDYADNTATFAFGQMKLITEAFPACNPNNIGSITAHILGGSPPFTYAWSNNTTSPTMQDVSGNYSVTVFDQSGQQVSGSDSIPVCNGFLLHAKCILQGFYDGNGIMNPVLTQSGIISPLAFTDTVTVNLHSTSFGFPMVASSQAILHTNGSIVCELPSSEIGNNRYIVIKHRNSFETWSANPITISAITNYDFTTSASQAFGDNQVEVENGIWAMFTGDINQDGNADLLDASMLEASMANFDFGYFVTDLNGDGNVDLLDSPVLEVNVNNFVFSNHP